MERQTKEEETLFEAARRLKGASERRFFLEEACLGRPALLKRVELLLAADSGADIFFAEGAAALEQSVLAIAAAEQPGGHIGHYKLLQKLGEGGCGIVYMAEQEKPVRRRVALKVIKLGMDTKNVVARFDAERQALAMMDHPNIARVFDGGATDTGRPFFVMELVRGTKITSYCDENRLSTRERLELFIQVCHAVQHAHQKGIIHRDLKPSNILVTTNDGVPVPKVIDFGIAKATQGRLTDLTLFTAFEQFLGTPAYMSPEQAVLTSLDIDTRSDIYSLGVLLYELLTGRTPFDTRQLLSLGLDELRRTIREVEPDRPSTRLRTMSFNEITITANDRHSHAPALIVLIRGDLDWIVMKCLDKDRSRRYQTANDLSLEIGLYLKGQPVLAHPISLFERGTRWCRRRPLVAGLGLTTAALILTIAIGSPIAALRIKGGRRRAESLLSTVEIQRARMCFAADEAQKGLAFLARAVRQNPDDALVASELINQLSMRGLVTAAVEPFKFNNPVYWAEFSRDGRRIAAASYDGTGWIFDASMKRRLAGPFQHAGAIRSIHFSPDDRRVATASWDHTARIWDASTGKSITPPLQHQGYVWNAQWSPDGRRLVTASYDGTAKIWDAQTGETLLTLQHAGQVAWAEFSPDGRLVATASWDKTAQLWDAATGEKVTTALRHQREVWTARFSSDGQWLVTCSWDKTARVWNVRTGEPAFSDPILHDGPVISARFSADNQSVLTTSWDKTARLWDAHTGKSLGTAMRHFDLIESADISPDGQLVVTASPDKSARIWDGHTGLPLSEPIHHDSSVLSAHFSADGRGLLTTAADGTVRLWDVRVPPLCVRRLTNSAPFLSLVFNALGEIESSPASQKPLAPRMAPVPVPHWVPDLVEMILGRRIADPSSLSNNSTGQPPIADLSDEMQPLQPNAFLTFKREQPWQKGKDFYAQWASWMLAEPWNRTLSPSSVATIKDYFEHLLAEGSIPALREATRLQPTNSLVFARLARKLLAAQAGVPHPIYDQAEWCSRRALSLDQNNWEAWWSKGEVLRHTGSLSESMQAMDEAAKKQPSTNDFWMAFGLMLESDNRLNEAESAFSRALTCSPEDRGANSAWTQALLARSRLRFSQGRTQEAIADRQLAIHTPIRPADIPRELIDLSSCYNASLDADWHDGRSGWTLAQIPKGRSALAGVEFDIRGIVQLGSPSFGGRNVSFPQSITNIQIGLKCAALHFLHATGWSCTDLTQVGTYRVHFADGVVEEIPILYGTNIRDWGAEWTDQRTDARSAVVAWKGNIVRTGGEGSLYRFTWINPRSTVEITRLDFESAMTGCAPFLLALTAEVSRSLHPLPEK